MAKLFVCGDIANTANNNDFIGPELKRIILDADYSVANLEGVELYNETSLNGSPFQEEGTCKYLKEAGFNLMLLANNHIADGGKERLVHTIDAIEQCGMEHIGASMSWDAAYKSLVKEFGDVKIAFINVAEAQPGYFYDKNQSFGFAWMGYDKLYADVNRLSHEVDYVVVFVHAGLEHYSLPLSEIRSFYQRLCESGASCVIGGHPHCAQGYEFYGDSFIAYSLGNFYFPRKNGAWPEENKSYSLCITLEKRNKIGVAAIYHSMNDFIVEVVNNTSNIVDVHKLCSLLDENYQTKADEMCVTAYNKLCKNLLVYSLCGEQASRINLKESVKNVLKRTIFRKRFIENTEKVRNKMLLHLYENESYRWTITRALQIITQQ